MAPFYDGKAPEQLYTWLGEVKRLNLPYTRTKTDVTQFTSRGSFQDLKLQNHDWDVIKMKLRERFSDCTNPAVAQNKLSLFAKYDRNMHEYISHFSDLCTAYSTNVEM